MLSKITSAALVGLDAVPVSVEVDLVKKGFPAFAIVGLADKAVQESKERVRSALINSQAEFPSYRLTVNLAPAELEKSGASFDLPLALGILIATEQLIPNVDLSDCLFFGELSLEGQVKPVQGALSFAMMARAKGFKNVFLPLQNSYEASLVEDVNIFPVATLNDLRSHISSQKLIPQFLEKWQMPLNDQFDLDFADIKGQEQAKRMLEIAVAGGHNVFLKGPPGAGKTLLSRSLASIMPALSTGEMLEITRIFSAAGLLNSDNPLVTKRPFRSPHHTVSRMGLVGGGSKIAPGEVTLAHRGVLFLDEFLELPRSVLEAMRQPLEDGFVQISRASGSLTYPSRFMLVAAANPCPCGFWGSKKKMCQCSPHQREQYQKRLSGPILDRIDLHLEVGEVEREKVFDQNIVSEGSKNIRQRIEKARQIQTNRFKNFGFLTNSEISAKQIKFFCPLMPEAEKLLENAFLKFNLSMRSYHKVLKVGRTIADLEGQDIIDLKQIAESLQYRFNENYAV